ncbi:glycosyltransferase [Psychrobacillus psychrotolerans]|uniref:glycosyltransferase n=1 Tax=Psychrobacillus psychrotolerans TaxID=126156 RepID=UPI0033146ADE
MMKEIEILFIGFLLSDEKMKEIYDKEKKLMHYAANKFQWNLIRGLKESEEIKRIIALSTPSISCYPSHPTIFMKQDKELKGKLEIKYIPFLNLRILKSLTTFISSIYHTLLWQLKNRKKDKLVVTYAMYNPYMLVNYLLGKLFSTPQIIVILDFPEFMNLKSDELDLLSSFIRKLNIKIGWKIVNSFDGYILLTEHIASKLNLGSEKYIILEGFADIDTNSSLSSSAEVKSEKRIVMYAGSLNEKYGVKDLIDGFEMLENNNFELWLCGIGDSESYIKERAKVDSRIKYYGQLDNKQVKLLQQKVHILINPRPSKHEFTKYSFPSKIMEYMSSGKAVVTTKLAGIPIEYYPYVHLLEDETPKGIANIILRVGSLTSEELESFGKTAYEFITFNKNYQAQSRKILRLFSKYV